MTNNALIRQGIELIGNFKSNMTYTEILLYYTILKNINGDENSFSVLEIPVEEFINDWNKNPKNAYKQVDDALHGLLSKVFEINIGREGKRETLKMSFLTLGHYKEGSAIVEIKINEDMKPFLLKLKERYVSLDIKNLKLLPNQKTIWLYEIMKQWQETGVFTASFDYLRFLYNNDEGFQWATDFDRKVITPSIEAINNNSDIEVEVKKYGKGKKSKWVFKISKKWENEEKVTYKTNNKESEANELFERLWKMYPRKKGKSAVSKKKKLELLKVGEEELTRCIERYKAETKGRSIDYILHGSTFFNGRYIDYLDENYQQEKTDISNPKDDQYERYKDFHTLDEALEYARKIGDI